MYHYLKFIYGYCNFNIIDDIKILILVNFTMSNN